MIIVTGGIKGGSGKTTIATHLAVMRAQNNSDTLLIDADDQEKYFCHVSGLIDQIAENDKVSFELEKGMKGMNAVKVTKI